MGSEVVRLSEVRVVHHTREMRRRWAGRTVVPALLAGAALTVAGMATGFMWGAVGALTVISGVSAVIWWLAGRDKPEESAPTMVLFSKDAITFEGQERITTIVPKDVEGAWASDGKLTLRLVTGRDVELEVSELSVSDRALTASSLSPYELSMRLPIASDLAMGPVSQTFFTFLVLASAAGFCAVVGWSMSAPDADGATVIEGTGVIAMFAPVIAIVLYRWLTALRRRHAVVGTDSVVFESSASSKTIPLSRIDGVSRDAKGVTLALSDGREVLLPSVQGGEGLLPRIEHALRCRGRAKGDNHDLELLARKGLSTQQWKQKLHELPLDRGEQYRERFVGREALGVVVGDAAAPPAQRVAAAVVLSSDKSQRSRIRAAAASCADEDMRAALEAAAEGELEEEALEKAEARLEKS